MADRDSIRKFLIILEAYYREHGRHDMLWRQPNADGSFDPYKILVSELMLQQTQVTRVTPKFVAFMGLFPDIETLANVQLGEVLQMWNGLGYNRRAKYLWQSAIYIRDNYRSKFPSDVKDLLQLPGVGPNTAGAILSYAYDRPTIYIETNIRTVMIHHFFQDQTDISDAQIRFVMRQILEGLDQLSPREFYWALMDYGSHLKLTVGNLNKFSKTYSSQSTFAGSRRQLRGQIIRMLSARSYTDAEITKVLDDDRTASVLRDLVSEQLIRQDNNILMLA